MAALEIVFVRFACSATQGGGSILRPACDATQGAGAF
jgi:hypothetical protein